MSRVVLVTGAGGGIGSAVAARFARRGDRVLLTDLAGASLEATSARLDARHRRLLHSALSNVGRRM